MSDDKEPTVFREIAGFRGERITLLDWSGQPPQFCNLLKIDADGNVIWRAKPHHPLEGVWTEVRMEGQNLRAYNWSGYSNLIDYETGRILHSTFVK